MRDRRPDRHARLQQQATIRWMKPTTAPTERSMPPVMITKVWPIARIAHHRALAQQVRRYCSRVKKLSVETRQANQSSSSSPSRRQAEQEAEAAASAARPVSVRRRQS